MKKKDEFPGNNVGEYTYVYEGDEWKRIRMPKGLYVKVFCPNCFNVMNGEIPRTPCFLCKTPTIPWSKDIENDARIRRKELLDDARGGEVGTDNPGQFIIYYSTVILITVVVRFPLAIYVIARSYFAT